MKIVAIVQARMGSTRFPGKVLKTIINKPVIELLLSRLSKSNFVDEIVVATSINPENEKLQTTVEALGYKCVRGSEKNVLKRFYETAMLLKADVIVRITGDCPFVDSELVDLCIKGFEDSKVDYFSNINPPTYPDGLDVEIISFASLERAINETNSEFDKEHVTTYIRNSDTFSKSSLTYKKDLSYERWSIDEPEDLVVIKKVFEHFSPHIHFNWLQVLDLKKFKPEIFISNQHIKNNEGADMITGQKLYKRAKKVIPGGNMLLSKRPEMFLPNKWPSYFTKSKGCKVWDLDSREFTDMSLMGVGTNILGYSHPEVDDAVQKVIRDGNMSTLNCPEEVYLAEKLIELHPWAEMVRFARTGGEANAIAVRIARASSGKEKIAICGYHGWHDWYLSTNLNNDKNLNSHLLPGLEPKGVPKGLTGTTLPFNYNNIKQLEELIQNNKGEIAAIKMEVLRNEEPKEFFLKKVRDLATENKIILIFDECTSGFRETFGGLHKKYNIEPDMAIFGKALGNGYAITSVIGKFDIMQEAQSSFISSTFWTERIGPSAALKTLEIMERDKSWEFISQIGNYISKRWMFLANKYELSLNTYGLPALSSFSFNSPKALSYKTLITQEMLKKGFLASNSIYVSTEHSKELVDIYIKELEPIFSIIKDCEEGFDINNILEVPLSHNGFKRLN